LVVEACCPARFVSGLVFFLWFVCDTVVVPSCAKLFSRIIELEEYTAISCLFAQLLVAQLLNTAGELLTVDDDHDQVVVFALVGSVGEVWRDLLEEVESEVARWERVQHSRSGQLFDFFDG